MLIVVGVRPVWHVACNKKSMHVNTSYKHNKSATAAVPGTAGTPELSDENGNVVYDVEVTAADGSKVGVKVDAGNGSVLAQETDDAGDEKGADKGEGPQGTQSGSETPDAPTSN